MDMNQLLHAHQMAQIGQATAPDHARRAAYADTLTILVTRIRTLRGDGGADVSAAQFVEGEPVADYRDR
jgi:hypothetical protein